MDADRFDSLLRAFSTRPSRRGMTRGLTALLLSGVLTPCHGLPEAEAKKNHKKKKKKKRGDPPLTSPPVSPPALPPGGCITDCRGKQCGDDGCGGLCGGCGLNQVCASGTCCIPEPVANTCQGRCGSWTNNCGQSVPCAVCPTGQKCLSNGTCGTPCTGGVPGTCASPCYCPQTGPEGDRICAQSSLCEDVPQGCAVTAGCPVGRQCILTGCGPGNTTALRCVPTCTT
jgi:hypothetical protein